ncbi:hypothetical protein ACQEVF_34165 [Nonomuraea polychroma]|uniref:hypothetical protein n=1 Tax=Nonomuraea polychroma TaxID=46176 RepID=UPI003D91F8F7
MATLDLEARQLDVLRADFPAWEIYRCRVRNTGRAMLMARLRRPLTDEMRAAGATQFLYGTDAGELASAMSRQAGPIHGYPVLALPI